MTGKRGRNGVVDAAAICEAMQRLNMRFVPVKSEDQRARQMLHRARLKLVSVRTACIHRIHESPSEVAHQGFGRHSL